ncbi:MAG: trypsin-like peptidase domain-containing protein [Lachnospiraceae bacterium]|nr:trypsin-like peptidase domain-containing protein [Lachnospiraceae bacterium]
MNTEQDVTYHFWAEGQTSSSDTSPETAPASDTKTPEAVTETATVHAASANETATEAADFATGSATGPVPDSGTDAAGDAPFFDPAPKKVKKEHRRLKKFFACVGLAVCFGLVAGGTFFGVKYAVSYFFPEQKALVEDFPKKDEVHERPDFSIAATPTNDVGETDASETVASVVEQTMPAMVSIKTLTTITSYNFFGQPFSEESEGGGSGIIVGSNENDLLIATNYHVIEKTSSVQVILADGTSHAATVKGSDAQSDLAILALPISGLTQETLDSIDVAVLGDSDSSRIGQMVVAIGNSLGHGPTVTVGYLSAKDRDVTISGNDMVLLQTNAAINEGNSGGALLNTKGEVIGINNAKLTSTEIEGICFAIPISKAIPILDDLMTREILSENEKGYLGVSVMELEADIFQYYGWPEGVYVSDVLKDSAAEKAGIYQGDIITKVNDTKVTTPNQLINAVTSNRYGTEIQITVQRIIEGKFKELTFHVTLQQNPELATQNSSEVPKLP